MLRKRIIKLDLGDGTLNEIAHDGRLDEALPLFSTGLHCLCAGNHLIREQSQIQKGSFFLLTLIGYLIPSTHLPNLLLPKLLRVR